MASEQTELAAQPDVVYNAPYEIQLINLGRILQDSKELHAFSTDDFSDGNIRKLIEVLKSDKPVETKRHFIKSFLGRRGVRDWGEGSYKKALFDAQRLQSKIGSLAFNVQVAIDYLQNYGTTGESSEWLTRNLMDIAELLKRNSDS